MSALNPYNLLLLEIKKIPVIIEIQITPVIIFNFYYDESHRIDERWCIMMIVIKKSRREEWLRFSEGNKNNSSPSVSVNCEDREKNDKIRRAISELTFLIVQKISDPAVSWYPGESGRSDIDPEDPVTTTNPAQARPDRYRTLSRPSWCRWKNDILRRIIGRRLRCWWGPQITSPATKRLCNIYLIRWKAQ